MLNTICFYVSVFVSMPDEWKLLKYICVLYLLLFVLSHKILSHREYRRLNFFLYSFVLIVLLSGILGDIKYGHYPWHVNVTSSFLLATQVLALFGYVEYVISRNLQRVFVRQLLTIICVCIIIADIKILFNLNSIIDSTSVNYIVGNKFDLCYSHIVFCALLLAYRRIPFIGIIVILSFCAVLSKLIYCTTGFIGALFFLFLILFENLFKKLLYKRLVLYTCVLLSVIFALLIGIIVNMEWIDRILYMLGESSTMNGRTIIYTQLAEIINGDPYFGYGNGNHQNYVEYYTEIGNAQNGILADIINWGVVGTFIFLMIPWGILGKSHYNRVNYPLLCLLYTFVILATVEVTMGTWFLSALSLFLLASYNSKNVISAFDKPKL